MLFILDADELGDIKHQWKYIDEKEQDYLHYHEQLHIQNPSLEHKENSNKGDYDEVEGRYHELAEDVCVLDMLNFSFYPITLILYNLFSTYLLWYINYKEERSYNTILKNT